MKKLQVLCDVCGIEKKETNNWYDIHEITGGIVISKFNEVKIEKCFNICGESCLHKKLNQLLEKL